MFKAIFKAYMFKAIFKDICSKLAHIIWKLGDLYKK